MKRTPISSRPSKRKQAFDAEYAKVLPEVLGRGCEFVTYVLAFQRSLTGPLEIWDGGFCFVDSDGSIEACSGPLIGHHAKGRRSVDANDPFNLRCLCDKHHRYVHANSRWSREVGLMISRIS